MNPIDSSTNLTNLTVASAIGKLHANIEKYVNETSQDIYKEIQEAIADCRCEVGRTIYSRHKDDPCIIQLCAFFKKLDFDVRCANLHYDSDCWITISWKNAYVAAYTIDVTPKENYLPS